MRNGLGPHGHGAGHTARHRRVGVLLHFCHAAAGFRVGYHGLRFLRGKAGEALHSLMLFPRSVCEAPPYALIQAVFQRVMYEPEHATAENDLINI